MTQGNCKDCEDMMHRINRTLEEFSKILELKNHESNTQYLSLPETAYGVTESNKTLSSFLSVAAEKTTMKTILSLFIEKEYTKMDVEIISFFHTKIGFSPLMNTYANRIYEGDKLISVTTFDKICLGCLRFN